MMYQRLWEKIRTSANMSPIATIAERLFEMRTVPPRTTSRPMNARFRTRRSCQQFKRIPIMKGTARQATPPTSAGPLERAKRTVACHRHHIRCFRVSDLPEFRYRRDVIAGNYDYEGESQG